jgi:hypothetical protein
VGKYHDELIGQLTVEAAAHEHQPCDEQSTHTWFAPTSPVFELHAP